MNSQVKEIDKGHPSFGKVECIFCQKTEVNSLEWGPLYQLAGVNVHYFCMLFSCGLSQNGEDDEGILGFMPIDIRKEVKRGEKLKCKYCKLARATIGCSVKSCKMMYHYPCGLAKDCGFQFIGNFESYCKQHKESLEIPLDELPDSCPICLDELKEEDKKLWPPCCKRNVFHKTCIMESAKNHGAHFFKCPLCNDKEVFSEAMRKEGVYVPERDASWETTPGAFQEHMTLYSKCDAKECLSKKGREFSQKADNKAWKIVRCGACASSAVHKRCANLRNLTWRCPTCAEILSDNRIRRQQYDLSDDEEIADAPDVARINISPPPDLEDDDSDSDNSQDESLLSNNVVFDERLRRRVVEENSSDDNAATTDSSSDELDEIFVQADSSIHDKIQKIKVLNKENVDSSHEDDWKAIRISAFAKQLKNLAIQSSRQNAVSRSEQGDGPDSGQPESPSEAVTFPPVDRSKLIKSSHRRNVPNQPLDESVEIVGTSESPEMTVKVASSRMREKLRQRKKPTDVSVNVESDKVKEQPSSVSVDVKTEDDDITEVERSPTKTSQECIIIDIDGEDSSSSSDLEIVDEKLSFPFNRSSALCEMLKRRRQGTNVKPVVRPPVLGQACISAAFLSSMKKPSKLSHSTGNPSSSSSVSDFMRKQTKCDDDIVVLSDDDDEPSAGRFLTDVSKKRLIIKDEDDATVKRRRTHD